MKQTFESSCIVSSLTMTISADYQLFPFNGGNVIRFSVFCFDIFSKLFKLLEHNNVRSACHILKLLSIYQIKICLQPLYTFLY